MPVYLSIRFLRYNYSLPHALIFLLFFEYYLLVIIPHFNLYSLEFHSPFFFVVGICSFVSITQQGLSHSHLPLTCAPSLFHVSFRPPSFLFPASSLPLLSLFSLSAAPLLSFIPLSSLLPPFLLYSLSTYIAYQYCVVV